MQAGSLSTAGKKKELEGTIEKHRRQKPKEDTSTLSSSSPGQTSWCLFCLSFTFCQNKLLYSCFHPLDAVTMRTSYRPKHQSLVLKCYPALPKDSGAKPNSSELSYLLYYASTRRSKLQKVGKFLEKRTASDVWRAKSG